MKTKNGATEAVTQFGNLADFYQHVKAIPGQHPDFDIREVDTKLQNPLNANVAPFHHNSYCISFYLEGGGQMHIGFCKTEVSKPALYFKTPNQILSLRMPEGIC